MANTRFTEQMQAYGQWKRAVLAGIQRYQAWLTKNGMGTPEEELHIYEILESLKSDRLTIAFVAEFARGKTELINAIFFSEYDRRLLPSEAGRTTMCPTELFYDSRQEQAYIKLLPIETRLNETSIAEYKNEPIHWTSIDLELDSPESMAEAFKEIVKVKQVSLDEARQLGLYSEEEHRLHTLDGKDPEFVEVPMWRHALISFPHPLLKQGLVILDTPGLNALGSEPELTISMLPNAHAIMFILAADTGVTKSDLDMWKHNVLPLQSGREKGIIVTLNKIDTLWDELKSDEAVDKTISEQCRKVAQILAIDTASVFPVSAQKGLLAKIRHDTQLLEKSNILNLEDILATDILPQKQRLVREHVLHAVGAMIKDTHSLLMSRLKAGKAQLEELRGLTGKNNEVIEHLMAKTREEQVAYHKNVESFQANKRLLGDQSQKLLALLGLEDLDRLVSRTRDQMTNSWTTGGLKRGMETLFEGMAARFREIEQYTEQLNRLVVTVYRKFHQEHGTEQLEPVLYSAAKHRLELEKLSKEAEIFRKSPVTTMTEQSYVVKKFFISLVSHARNVFTQAHKEAEHWSKAVMSPLVRQIKDHKAQMEKRLENLRRINESRDTLQARIQELEKSTAALYLQYKEIDAILKLINSPLSSEKAVPEQAAAAG